MATQDADTVPANESEDRPLTPRELAMQEIAERREQAHVDEAAEQLALQTQAAEPAPAATQTDTAQMVTVKVDGVETQVPLSEVVSSYQKASAATLRLQEAARVLEEARRTAATAKPPAQVEETTTGDDTPSSPTPESLGEFVDTLFEGDKDKAVAALARLGIGRAESAIPTQEQLVAQLTPTIRQQLMEESALERFAQDNADLAADPHLTGVTNGFIQAAVDEGMPYVEALGEGAKRTREWMGKLGIQTTAPTPEPTPGPTTTTQSKLERKANIDEVNALNRSANTSTPVPETTSSVIEQMRKARGQSA